MIRVRQIFIKIENNTDKDLIKKLSQKLKVKESDILDFKINKSSLFFKGVLNDSRSNNKQNSKKIK